MSVIRRLVLALLVVLGFTTGGTRSLLGLAAQAEGSGGKNPGASSADSLTPESKNVLEDALSTSHSDDLEGKVFMIEGGQIKILGNKGDILNPHHERPSCL